ncbi:MAG: 4-oxalocrotonate tautomerase family protein [Oligoflexia bacterium]|nr:4-oxalocrotonate tautomerase family protein [Oligoflexia bacterium]
MPYVNVKVAGPLTTEQRSELAKRISLALEEVAGKPAAHTYIVFDEVPREKWAVGAEILAERDKKSRS